MALGAIYRNEDLLIEGMVGGGGLHLMDYIMSSAFMLGFVGRGGWRVEEVKLRTKRGLGKESGDLLIGGEE